MVSVFLFFALLSNIVLSRVAYNNSTSSLLDSALFYTDRIVSQTISNLDAYIYEYELLLSALSSNPHLIKLITEKGQLTMEERLYHERQCSVYLEHIMESKTGTMGLLIVGANGYLHTDDARLMLNTSYDYVHAPWFQETLAFDEKDILNISAIDVDFYKRNSSLYGKCWPTLSYPVRDYSEEKIGVIYCFLDPSSLESSLYLDNFEDFGGVFLINQDREIVLHRDKAMLNTVLSGELLEAASSGAEGFSQQEAARSDDLWVKTPAKYVRADAICRISSDGIAERTRRYQQPLSMSITLCTLITVALGILLFFFFRRAINRLMLDLHSSETEQQEHFTPKNYRITELNQIAQQISSLLDDIGQLNQKNYEVHLSAKLAQLNVLVSQMNPHFFYNALQLLQTEMTCGSPETAERMLLSLSRLLRYATEKQSMSVALKDELDFVRNYLDIFQAEVEGRFQYSVYCPSELMQLKVPKFLLQPLVENSLRHGFPDGVYESRITITVSSCFDSLAISVIDNGKGLSPDRLSELRQSLRNATVVSGEQTSVGICNIHHRIHLIYGMEYGLSIDSQEGKYTKIDILLPREGKIRETIDYR